MAQLPTSSRDVEAALTWCLIEGEVVPGTFEVRKSSKSSTAPTPQCHFAAHPEDEVAASAVAGEGLAGEEVSHSPAERHAMLYDLLIWHANRPGWYSAVIWTTSSCPRFANTQSRCNFAVPKFSQKWDPLSMPAKARCFANRSIQSFHISMHRSTWKIRYSPL